jgi:ferritin-like protein
MASSSGSLHEDAAELKTETVERHRAFVSIQEELEAADWYDQRVDASKDPELRAILAHNRDEEKEHAAMVLEWLRRRDPKMDEHLRTYLFTKGSILEIEENMGAEGGGESGKSAPKEGSASGEGSLGIGSLIGTGGLVVTGA